MVTRIINHEIIKSSKSVLILGPRQVGKSTLIQSLSPDLEINLADEFEFLKYSSQADELRRLIELQKPKTVFIDEVQRLPSILNTIQSLIDEKKKIKFYLTGSSARKLRRGQANLLPGRIFSYKMGPLVGAELDYKLDIRKALSVGLLPEVYLNKNINEAKKLIKSYVAIYLKEEIKAEALVRQLDSFARFLAEIMNCVGQFVDFSKLSKKAKISRHAVPRYFEILEDTMIGYRLFPFADSSQDYISQDLIKHPKFYFFDIGIYNSLMNNFEPSIDRVGFMAEQLVYNQLLHSAWARDKEIEISTYKTRQGVEVDFIVKIENHVFALEVKSSDRFGTDDIFGLEEFAKVFPKVKGLFLIHLGEKELKLGPVWCLPLNKALQKLGL